MSPRKNVLWMVLALSLLVVIVSGCAAAAPARSAAPAPAANQPAAPAAPAAKPGAPASGASTGSEVASADVVAADSARMIVQTVELSLVVAKPQQALANITTLTTGAGGFVADSSVWRQDEQDYARVTIRVPADKLNDTLNSLRQAAVRIDKETMKGNDVTEEYSDLTAQVTNLEAKEKELRQLMADMREKTQKAEDILAVYREVAATRSDIDRIKGRMQFLEQSSSMATINVDLIPDAATRPVVQEGWRPSETVRDAGRQLVSALQGVGKAALYLVILVVPLLLVIGLPIVLLVLFVRWLTRRSRKATGTGGKTGTPAPAA